MKITSDKYRLMAHYDAELVLGTWIFAAPKIPKTKSNRASQIKLNPFLCVQISIIYNNNALRQFIISINQRRITFLFFYSTIILMRRTEW